MEDCKSSNIGSNIYCMFTTTERDWKNHKKGKKSASMMSNNNEKGIEKWRKSEKVNGDCHFTVTAEQEQE